MTIADVSKCPLVSFPVQCPDCRHLYLEKYVIAIDETHIRPFVWCGFCRKRENLPMVEVKEEINDK